METVITVLIIIFAALDVLGRAARRRAMAEREAERRTAGPLPRRAPAPQDERPAPWPAEDDPGSGELRPPWLAPRPAAEGSPPRPEGRPARRAPASPPAEWAGEGPPPPERPQVPGEPPQPPSWAWLREVRRPRVDFPGPAFSGPDADARTLRAVVAWTALLGPPRARRPWRPPGYAREER